MSAETLKIATFNIHHAEGRDKVVDLTRTADFIRWLGADLIALQELDVGARRSRTEDQPAKLAELLEMHVYFARTVKFDKGAYGIALASTDEFRGAIEQLPRTGTEEPRVAIIASWQGIGVVTTHLSRDSGARRVQTEKLARLGSQLGSPSIILGDLNQARRHLKPLTSTGFTIATPSRRFGLPRLGPDLDHILLNGLIARSSSTIPTEVSDHPAVVVEVTRGR